MDGVHDMGAMDGFGPIDVGADDTSHFEWGTRLQVVAMISGGARRSGIEAIDPARYLAADYHERWLIAAETGLVERGRVEADALDSWLGRLANDDELETPTSVREGGVAGLIAGITTTPPMHPVVDAQFAVADRVRVKQMWARTHHRCPRYVRGVVGVVESIPGADPLPETDAGVEPVYTVRFDSIDLWGDRSQDGEPGHDLYIDLWQSYLEAP